MANREEVLVRIRMYKRHDMDLISLFMNKEYDFRKIVRESLKAYAEGRIFFYAPPKKNPEKVDYSNRRSFNTSILVKRDLDPEIYDLVISFKDLHRNAAIKSIIRGTILGSYVYDCIDHSSRNEESGYKEIALKINNRIKEHGVEEDKIFEMPLRKKRRKSSKAADKPEVAKGPEVANRIEAANKSEARKEPEVTTQLEETSRLKEFEKLEDTKDAPKMLPAEETPESISEETTLERTIELENITTDEEVPEEASITEDYIPEQETEYEPEVEFNPFKAFQGVVGI